VRWADGRLLGFDLEATGVDPFSDFPVAYALVLHRPDGHRSVMRAIVDPPCEIPDDAAAIHGITTARARAEGVAIWDALTLITEKLLWAMAEGIPVVGMNLSYDLTMIHNLTSALPADFRPVLDVLVLDKHVNKYRKGSRKLPALCEHYGVPVSAEHDATADAVASLDILLAMERGSKWLGLKTAGELHWSQIGWRRTQQMELSEYFVAEGKPAIPETEWEWPLLGAPESLETPPSAPVGAPPSPVPSRMESLASRDYPVETDPELATFDPQMLNATRLMVASFKAAEVRDYLKHFGELSPEESLEERRTLLVLVIARLRHVDDPEACAMF
jgi:DNA polymerase III subunit epsilon